jgi:hypothetical protein
MGCEVGWIETTRCGADGSSGLMILVIELSFCFLCFLAV